MIISKEYAEKIRIEHSGSGVNWTGVKRGRLEWLHKTSVFSESRNRSKWVAQCSCGRLYIGYPMSAMSCGCLAIERSIEARSKARTLNKEQVLQILTDRAWGSAKRYARQFGISSGSVSAIRSGAYYADWYREWSQSRNELSEFLPIRQELELVKKKLRNAQSELSRLRAFIKQFKE